MTTFTVGDVMTWQSESRGSVMKRKQGTVVRVLAPHETPTRQCRACLAGHKTMAYGTTPRGHESYLVSVPAKTSKGKPTLHWPRVAWMKKVEHE